MQNLFALVLPAVVLFSTACGGPVDGSGDAPRPAAPSTDRPGSDGGLDAGATADAGTEQTDGGSIPDAGTSIPACAALESSNAIAALSGTAIGSGAVPNSELRRAIPFNMSPQPQGFSVPEAFLVRSDPASTTVRLIAVVRNDGATTRCRITVNNVRWLDSSLGLYRHDSLLPVLGSVGLHDIPYEGCLAPGEIGYVHSVLSGSASNYNNVEFINTDGITSYPADGAPAGILVGTGYTAGGRLDVTVKNTGANAVRLKAAALLLLDSSGGPLYWSWADLDPSGPPLDPAQSRTLTVSPFSYSGTTSTVRPLIVYEDVPACVR